MKLFLFSLLFLTSCVSTYQLKTSCNQNAINELTPMLINEGFKIKSKTPNYLEAETPQEFDAYANSYTYKSWKFNIDSAKITAECNTYLVSKGVFLIHSVGGNVSDKYNWYWNIHNGLEGICGNKLEIIENTR